MKFTIYQWSIPTNNPMIRKDYNDQIFRTELEKNEAIIKKLKNVFKLDNLFNFYI